MRSSAAEGRPLFAKQWVSMWVSGTEKGSGQRDQDVGYRVNCVCFRSASHASAPKQFPHFLTPVCRYDTQRVVQQLQGLASGDVVTWGVTGWEGGLQEEGQREHAAEIEGGGITG